MRILRFLVSRLDLDHVSSTTTVFVKSSSGKVLKKESTFQYMIMDCM
jgi:hypothetical protein